MHIAKAIKKHGYSAFSLTIHIVEVHTRHDLLKLEQTYLDTYVLPAPLIRRFASGGYTPSSLGKPVFIYFKDQLVGIWASLTLAQEFTGIYRATLAKYLDTDELCLKTYRVQSKQYH